jgi:ribosome modulation factor
MNRFPLTRWCPGECSHSDIEHFAFDAGIAAGERGAGEDACPYLGGLREAWLTGHSVTYKHQPPAAAARDDSHRR